MITTSYHTLETSTYGFLGTGIPSTTSGALVSVPVLKLLVELVASVLVTFGGEYGGGIGNEDATVFRGREVYVLVVGTSFAATLMRHSKAISSDGNCKLLRQRDVGVFGSITDSLRTSR